MKMNFNLKLQQIKRKKLKPMYMHEIEVAPTQREDEH